MLALRLFTNFLLIISILLISACGGPAKPDADAEEGGHIAELATRTAEEAKALTQRLNLSQEEIGEKWSWLTETDIGAWSESMQQSAAARAESLRADASARWQSTTTAAERRAAEARTQASLAKLIPAGQSRAGEAWDGLTTVPAVEAAREQIEQASAAVAGYVGERLWQEVEQKRDEIVFSAVQQMVEEALLATTDIDTQEVAATLALDVSHRAARQAVEMTADELLASTLELSSDEWADILTVSAVEAAEAASYQFLRQIGLAGGLTIVTGNPIIISSIVSFTMIKFTTILLKHVVAETLLRVTEVEA